MRVTAVLQPNSCLLNQLYCQRSTISDHREGQLRGSMIWQTKLWTKKKGLNSAWQWFLPHPAWNHKSKSMRSQAATITYYSHWLDYVFLRYFSFTGSASKITVGNGRTPTLSLMNIDHAIRFIHRFENATQNKANVSHYVYVCGSISVLLSMHMHFPLWVYCKIGKHTVTVLYLPETGVNSCSAPGIWLQNGAISPFIYIFF